METQILIPYECLYTLCPLTALIIKMDSFFIQFGLKNMKLLISIYNRNTFLIYATNDTINYPVDNQTIIHFIALKYTKKNELNLSHIV